MVLHSFFVTIKLNFSVTPIWLVLVFCRMVFYLLNLDYILVVQRQSDICAPITLVALRGYTYFLTFIDDFL